MGTWGPNIFENDTACDVIYSLVRSCSDDLKDFIQAAEPCVEDIDIVAACAAGHLALYRASGSNAPERTQALILRDKVLRIHDAEIEELGGSPEFNAARRAALQKLLDEYVDAAGD